MTEKTSDIFFIIRGNVNTTNEHVEKATKELLETITKFCGGSTTILTSLVV